MLWHSGYIRCRILNTELAVRRKRGWPQRSMNLYICGGKKHISYSHLKQ